MDLESLLHPAISSRALKLFRDGHCRDATLNAIVAVFDLLRFRTGLTLDGQDLVNRVFSEKRPHLYFADLSTESGRNMQVGVMQMARGLYQGIRSPAAHTVTHEFEPIQAARYLVVASALAQLIEDARPGDILRFDGVYAAPADPFGTTFLRFYADMTVLRVSVGSNIADDWTPDWLTPDWANWEGHFSGKYDLQGTDLAFLVPLRDGQVTYQGKIYGSSIRLKWKNSATGEGGKNEYSFRPFPWVAA